MKIKNLCPHCQKHEIFHSLSSLHRECPQCGYKFYREPGYFTGALMLTYIVTGILIFPLFLTLLLKEYTFFTIIIYPLILGLALSPFTFRLSRLIWIHLDYKLESMKE